MTRENIGNTKVRIKVNCVACFDTVGSLGIPKVSWWPWKGGDDEYRFYDTSLSDHVLHAFQALALDETRGPFSPAVWERTPDNTTTELRQVWFPGNHGNVGGGWPDQGPSNVSMACKYPSLRHPPRNVDERGA